MTGFIASLALVVTAAATAPVEAPTRRFALVLGHNTPDVPGLPVLRYADDDAVEMHRLLRDAGADSVLMASLDEDTRARAGEDVAPRVPTPAAVRATLEVLVQRMKDAVGQGSRVEFLFFYSGHGGVERGQGYVTLQDGRMTRADVHRMLEMSPAHVNHVMVDACRSYFLAFEKGVRGRRRATRDAVDAGLDEASRAPTGFILSTASDRDSHEWERFRGGVFSHELRSALRGAADVDRDGVVTYAEVGAFLSVANAAMDLPAFRPVHHVRAPAGADMGQPVLAWSGGDTLDVPADFPRHAYVEDPRGTRLADMHPAPGTPLTLHLPRERPLFLRAADGSTEFVVDQPGAVHVGDLVARTPDVMPRGAADLAFLRLFERGFSARDVVEFVESSRRASAYVDRRCGACDATWEFAPRVLAAMALFAVPLPPAGVAMVLAGVAFAAGLALSPDFVGALATPGLARTPRYVALRVPPVLFLGAGTTLVALAVPVLVLAPIVVLASFLDT